MACDTSMEVLHSCGTSEPVMYPKVSPRRGYLTRVEGLEPSTAGFVDRSVVTRTTFLVLVAGFRPPFARTGGESSDYRGSRAGNLPR